MCVRLRRARDMCVRLRRAPCHVSGAEEGGGGGVTAIQSEAVTIHLISAPLSDGERVQDGGGHDSSVPDTISS